MAAYDDMLQAGVVEDEAFATAVNSHQGLGHLATTNLPMRRI